MSNKDRYLFNIIYLAIAILWPLVKSIYLGGIDGAGRVEIMLMSIAVIINFNYIFKSPKTMLIWILWIVYVVICSTYKGFQNDFQSFGNWVPTSLVFPYVTTLVSYQAIIFDYKKTVKILFWCYLLYVILGAVSMTSIESYDGSLRMMTAMGNTFFNTSILFAAFASLFYSHGKLHKLLYLSLLLLVFYVIFRSGERKGLICVLIIIFGALFAMNAEQGRKTIIYLLFLILLGLGLMSIIMEHSTAGQRLANSMIESQFEDNWFLKLMGDRGIMYYLGWDMFLHNFWTGIGITNFCWQNGYMTGLPFHTEYMVQLAECGIIGSILFAVLYYGMINRLLVCYRRKIAIKDTIILIATLLAIVIINLVSWTYDNANYFMMFGIFYGFTQNVKESLPNKFS